MVRMCPKLNMGDIELIGNILCSLQPQHNTCWRLWHHGSGRPIAAFRQQGIQPDTGYGVQPDPG